MTTIHLYREGFIALILNKAEATEDTSSYIFSQKLLDLVLTDADEGHPPNHQHWRCVPCTAYGQISFGVRPLDLTYGRALIYFPISSLSTQP